MQVVSSIPPDYVVDSFWMSQRGERVGDATPRRHRPYTYEFCDAKVRRQHFLWGFETGRGFM